MLLDEAEAGGRGAAGSVALVGAGPGDPELLTLKALRALQSADVVVVRRSRGPGHRRDGAARGGKNLLSASAATSRPAGRIISLRCMISLACQGKRVVRLKGGDPMIFGRADEEIAALRAAGIPVEVIPGVTAALGAAAAMQISLTEPRKSPQAAIHHSPCA